jgi:hypothetical protein
MTGEAEPLLKLFINLTLLNPISLKGRGRIYLNGVSPIHPFVIIDLCVDKLVKS